MKVWNRNFYWEFAPDNYKIGDVVSITTKPHTDFWQRTYYGFRNDNGHCLLTKVDDKYFSMTVKTEFDYNRRFDQCGIIIYQNSDNWAKASIEYENTDFQRLGSVVTNNGYSDWATTDISADVKNMYYRLSRRESDFCIEQSFDGINFKQMRIFHLFEGKDEINIGIYACSPENSSFEAKFMEFNIGECQWQAHK